MKKMILNIKRAFLFLALMFAFISVSAQALRTGYFLEGDLYRYRLNPALNSVRGHVAIPVLGGIQLNTMGNVGLGNFLYDSPYDNNEMVTFMHSSVDAKEFLGDLDSENIMRLDADFTILSLAFHAMGGFNTIDLSLRSNTGLNIPYGMFEFMKDMGQENYSFSDLGMRTRNFADLSIGHSHKIGKSLTVGARLKVLFGLAYANVNFDNMNIGMGRDKWTISASGKADIALGGQYTISDEPTISGKTVIDGYDDVAVGLHGFGIGTDLGVTYDFSELFLKGLTASLSVTDLGYISWSKTARAAISPDAPYEFNGFSEMGIHSGNDKLTLDEQWEKTSDELEDFFALEDQGEGSVTSGIGAKLNFGLEYKMPFYNKLSAGFLYTHCFDDVYSYNQASLILSISPLKVIDFAVSGTYSDYGTGFGAMANIHCKGFGFFIGTDCFLGKLGKQFVPVENMNASISFGLNIALGRHEEE